MGDPTDRGRDALRDAARERIAQSRLPVQKASRMWGGSGTGQTCSLCDKPILSTEPEMELEFEIGGTKSVVRFHLQCQSAWDEARRPLAPVGAVLRALPPGADPEFKLRHRS